jgi:hypothetical protein
LARRLLAERSDGGLLDPRLRFEVLVPIAGGDAVAIADNLTNGQGGTYCNPGPCGLRPGSDPYLPQPGEVVVGPNAAYFVDPHSSVDAILSAPK